MLRFDQYCFSINDGKWLPAEEQVGIQLNLFNIAWRPGLLTASNIQQAVDTGAMASALGQQLLMSLIREMCPVISGFLLDRLVEPSESTHLRWRWILFSMGAHALHGTRVRVEIIEEDAAATLVDFWNAVATHQMHSESCDPLYHAPRIGIEMGSAFAQNCSVDLMTVFRFYRRRTARATGPGTIEEAATEFEDGCWAEMPTFFALCVIFTRCAWSEPVRLSVSM